jgi:hypothetical protein
MQESWRSLDLFEGHTSSCARCEIYPFGGGGSCFAVRMDREVQNVSWCTSRVFASELGTSTVPVVSTLYAINSKVIRNASSKGIVRQKCEKGLTNVLTK